jgi:AcrR family transcriptional regulator
MNEKKKQHEALRAPHRKVNPFLRRQQILQAALQVFSAKGFTAATIPQIAGLAGVAAGTIYLYYPSKRDLFVAVVDKLVVVPLREIFARESTGDYLPTIKSAFMDRISIMQSDRLSGILSLMGEVQRDPELKKMVVERLVRPFLVNMEKYYAGHINQESPGKIEPALLVRAIAGLMIGLTVMKGLEGESNPLNRMPAEQAAEQLLEFVLYGLSGNLENPGRREANE